MTQRAQQQLIVLNALERGELRMTEAADLLGLSTRQVRRLRRAYRRHGPKALVHGNRGRRSPRRVRDAIRKRIVRLAQTTYTGINHKHLSELLAEREGLAFSHPTIHRILREAGLRSPRHRRRRERMPQAGLLVQLDGSHHPWLDQRGPRLTLVAAMDDATGEVLAATFRDEEDAHGYFVVFEALTQTNGIPVAAYSDRHGIFHRTARQPLTLQEQLTGNPAPTQVARALQELGIRWIPASSPQAKGRIERLFGTFQDRLRSELRLAGVRDRIGANAFLAKFLPRHNARFRQPAANPVSAYRPWPVALDPTTVFCFKYRRIVANDNTVTLGPHCVQICSDATARSYAKLPIELHERLDGSIAVYYQGRRLRSHFVPPRAPARVPARSYPRVGLTETGLRRGDRSLRGPRISSSRGEA
ncbi:MAG: ISNCY family transposase, partial [Candidatus Methylomirabilaceae bacterium]